MESKGHEILVSARDKEVTHDLLNAYNIKFVTRSSGRSSLFGKLIYILEADFKLFNMARKFKPDIFLSFGSAYAAHVSKLIRAPHIVFDDTEHAKYEHMMYVPFSDCIITPSSFRKNFGVKHVTFNGSMDMAYLHPEYFKDNIKCLDDQKLKPKSYFLLRFVNWDASHDRGHTGFSQQGKSKLIEMLNDYGTVVISSENELPEEFKRYIYKGDPKDIHTLLRHASLLIGESGSMATETAILGTPSIVVNSSVKHLGVFEHISKFGNLFYFDEENSAIQKVQELLGSNDLNITSLHNAEQYIKKSINLTNFMVWFIENYPDSFVSMKKNPNNQNNFK